MSGRGSRAIGVGMALLGLAAIALALGLREGTATGGPGTRFLPILVSAIVVVLGVRIALSASAPGEVGEAPGSGGVARVVATLVALLLYVLAFTRLGFVLSTAPFLAVLLIAYGERRWPVVLAVAVGSTAATYLLFATWLGIPLPPGVMAGWLG